MKIMKRLPLALLTVLALSLGSCSSDNADGGSSLKVNNKSFGIGSNSGSSIWNSTLFHASTGTDDANVRQFIVLDKNSIHDAEQKYLVVSVAWPAGQSGIDGIYDLDIASSSAVRYAQVSYYDGASEFGSFPDTSAGTLIVKDNGNANYTLTFDNVVLNDYETPSNAETKTIKGAVKTKFGTLVGVD